MYYLHKNISYHKTCDGVFNVPAAPCTPEPPSLPSADRHQADWGEGAAAPAGARRVRRNGGQHAKCVIRTADFMIERITRETNFENHYFFGCYFAFSYLRIGFYFEMYASFNAPYSISCRSRKKPAVGCFSFSARKRDFHNQKQKGRSTPFWFWFQS